MRKDRREEKAVTIRTTASYHHGRHEENKLFTSDRYIKLNRNYERTDGKAYKAYGLEIETECFSGIPNSAYAEVLDKIVFPHFPKDLFKIEQDGSLGTSSTSATAEIVTQVMTKEFIRNNYANWKLMYNTYFQAFGISASRTGNCGMHVNISNACFGNTKETQDKAIRKLYYFINHYYPLTCSLLRRNTNRTGYCSRMQHDKTYCKNLDLDGMARYNSHQISFNFGHYDEGQGRIELRLVGGQKDFGSFRNTMETIFHLVDAVKTLSWEDMDDMVKVFSGCNQYVFNRLKLAMDEGQLSASDIGRIRETVKTVEYL